MLISSCSLSAASEGGLQTDAQDDFRGYRAIITDLSMMTTDARANSDATQAAWMMSSSRGRDPTFAATLPSDVWMLAIFTLSP